MENRTTRRFVWHDLDSADPDRVLPFYTNVMGWNPEPYQGGPMRYWMWMLDGVPVGGIGELTDEAGDYGARPGWKGYIESADVDLDVDRVAALGGRVRMAPATLETVGRMAVVEDPQGAPFTLFAPDPAMSPPPSDSVIGGFVWHDLSTSDAEAAWTFYSGMLGWTEARQLPMDELGSYRTFTAGDVEIGGMMSYGPREDLKPRWVYYVHIADIEDAVRRVRSGGGELVGPLVDVPGGRSVQCRDPEGSEFGLYQATDRSES